MWHGSAVNSAKPGRATPAEAMGSQTGWQPDWGWGMLDLSTAFAQRLNFATASSGSRPGAGPARPRASTARPSAPATARRSPGTAARSAASASAARRKGSPSRISSSSSSTAPARLPRRARATSITSSRRARLAAATSSTRSGSASDVVGLDGRALRARGEDSADARSSRLSPTSRFTRASRPASPGDVVTLTAELVNPSPDLTGLGTSVTLDLPAGAELVSGSQTQDLGTLETNGSSGDTATASWDVRLPDAGPQDFAARAETTRYGESFRSQANATVAVQSPQTDPPPPPPPPGAAPPAPPPPPATPPRPSARSSALLQDPQRAAWPAQPGRVRHAGSHLPGTVTLIYSTRVRGRMVRVRRSVSAASGRFRGSLRLPRSASSAAASQCDTAGTVAIFRRACAGV